MNRLKAPYYIYLFLISLFLQFMNIKKIISTSLLLFLSPAKCVLKIGDLWHCCDFQFGPVLDSGSCDL